MENKRSGILIKDLLIKLLIIIVFVFLLIYFFPTKNSLKPLFQDVFRNNLNAMQKAGETYFTNERLPGKEGESVKIVLGEMVDKHLLYDFVDKNGDKCDNYRSYVEVTRMATEYEMKVNLVCPSDEGYIIEHMGCRDLCTAINKCPECSSKCPECPSCDKKEEPKKCYDDVKSYQFKRTVSKNVTKYKCPNGGTLHNGYCHMGATTDKKNIVVTTDYKAATVINDKDKVSYASYLCENGYGSCSSGWTASGSICYKGYDYRSVGGGFTGYNYSNCPTNIRNPYSIGSPMPTGIISDGVIRVSNGSKPVTSCSSSCSTVTYYYYSEYSCVANYAPVTQEAYCKTGNKVNGRCETSRPTTSVCNTCPSGYEKNPNGSGSTACMKTEKGGFLRYECPTGYDLENARCKKDTYSCPTGYDISDNKKECVKITANSKYKATSYIEKVASTEYKWSTSKTLSGWTATGKTTTNKVEVKCNK